MTHSEVKIPTKDANSFERMIPMCGIDYMFEILTLLFLKEWLRAICEPTFPLYNYRFRLRFEESSLS